MSKDQVSQGFSLVVSRKIRERRRDAGMSQRTLASHLGVTPAAVCYYESGSRTPSLNVLIKIICVLGFSLRDCIETLEAAGVVKQKKR